LIVSRSLILPPTGRDRSKVEWVGGSNGIRIPNRIWIWTTNKISIFFFEQLYYVVHSLLLWPKLLIRFVFDFNGPKRLWINQTKQ
jgi:hypothetical protein